MEILGNIAWETWQTLLVASPFVLLGLMLAGLLHLLIPARLVERWLGQTGMSGVLRAAAIGVPLPVCSCGVVPIAVEMKRKGASTPSSLSFLVTTPESSLDSILLTWGLMGPVMAIARPIAAVLTALFGGALAMTYMPSSKPEPAPTPTCGCGGEHSHGKDHTHALESPEAPAARAALAAVFGRRPPEADTARPGLWKALVRPALRYSCVELLDDLAFWLVLGILAAGLLGAVVPADLSAYGLGTGLWPMLLVLVVSVPLYMCASASTPIAAALLAKGLSPGAALVFLLAGPATNAATAILLDRTFGRRFVKIYLLSVVVGALASGLLLDAAFGFFGWQVAVSLSAMSGHVGHHFELASAVLLGCLLVWRLSSGAWSQGWGELRSSLAPLAGRAG